MQKNTHFSAILQIIVRGVAIGVVALAVFLGGIFAVANAADSGGKFGEILNKILASGNWQTDTTGLVNNAQKLGGVEASKFQQIATANPSCPAGQCVVGFEANGNIKCQ